MNIKLIIYILLLDSFLPLLSFLRGYYYGKYSILNNMNKLFIMDNYINNGIFGINKKFYLIDIGILLESFSNILYIFIMTSYKKNDDNNMYYLNNIEKYKKKNKTILDWGKFGFNIGQLISYN